MNLYESFKKNLNESDGLPTWRGVPETIYRYHGEWSDPEVEWNGSLYNEWDLTEYLGEDFDYYCQENGIDIDKDDYGKWSAALTKWLQEDPERAYNALQDLTPIDSAEMYESAKGKKKKAIKESCKGKKKKNLKEADHKIWSNTGSIDYYYDLSREEMIEEIKANGWDEEEINGEPILNADDEELREYLMPQDLDLDYEDYKQSIEPMIEKQCYEDILVLSGKAANWRGAFEACKVIKVGDFGEYLFPNYDAHTVIYCTDNDDLYYTESNHDTPMGGTAMYLYSFKDEDAYNKAEVEYGKYFEDDEPDMYYFAEWADYTLIGTLIDMGILTPVKRDGSYVGLDESCKGKKKQVIKEYDINDDSDWHPESKRNEKDAVNVEFPPDDKLFMQWRDPNGKPYDYKITVADYHKLSDDERMAIEEKIEKEYGPIGSSGVDMSFTLKKHPKKKLKKESEKKYKNPGTKKVSVDKVTSDDLNGAGVNFKISPSGKDSGEEFKSINNDLYLTAFWSSNEPFPGEDWDEEKEEWENPDDVWGIYFEIYDANGDEVDGGELLTYDEDEWDAKELCKDMMELCGYNVDTANIEHLDNGSYEDVMPFNESAKGKKCPKCGKEVCECDKPIKEAEEIRLSDDYAKAYEELQEMVSGIADAEVALEDIGHKELTNELIDLINSKHFKGVNEVVEFIIFSDEVDALRDSVELNEVEKKTEEYQIEYWVDEEARDEGYSDIEYIDATDVEDAIAQAKKYYRREDWASCELEDADGNVLFGIYPEEDGGEVSYLEEAVKLPRNAKKVRLGADTYSKDGDSWTKDGEKSFGIPTRYTNDFLRSKGFGLQKDDDFEVVEVDENYKPNKTKAVKVLQGNYGYGWDDLLTYDSNSKEDLEDLRARYKEYKDNEPNAGHRIITRRVPLDESVYALTPEYGGRQSYYGKALVEITPDGKTLYSYDTPIMTITKDGAIKMLCGEWALTNTTIRHIREFMQQEGLSVMPKAKLVKLINEQGVEN